VSCIYQQVQFGGVKMYCGWGKTLDIPPAVERWVCFATLCRKPVPQFTSNESSASAKYAGIGSRSLNHRVFSHDRSIVPVSGDVPPFSASLVEWSPRLACQSITRTKKRRIYHFSILCIPISHWNQTRCVSSETNLTKVVNRSFAFPTSAQTYYPSTRTTRRVMC